MRQSQNTALELTATDLKGRTGMERKVERREEEGLDKRALLALLVLAVGCAWKNTLNSLW